MTERADSQSQEHTTSLAHYLAPLRDHRRVILLVTVATLALGALVALAGPQRYTARTSVLIYPVAADPTEALQGGDRSDDMATELRIAESRAVAEMTATELDALGIDVGISAAADAITVANPEDSRVLTISYQAAEPATARVGSELAAAAYLAYRSELNAASRQVARTSINDEISVLQDRLTVAEEQFTQAAAGSSARLVAEIELTSIDGELGAQQEALADLSTLSIDAATVFDEANEPRSADGLGPAQLLVGALAGGLVLGVIVAWTMAALGLPAPSKRPARTSGTSNRSDGDSGSGDDDRDDTSDADSPFDDSDNRDPLELLKALEAVEADPAISLNPPPAAEAEAEPAPEPQPTAELAALPSIVQPVSFDASIATPVAVAETDAVVDDEPVAVPEIHDEVEFHASLEAEDTVVDASVPFDEAEFRTGFDATVDLEVNDSDEFEVPAVTHGPLVAELQANDAEHNDAEHNDAEHNDAEYNDIEYIEYNELQVNDVFKNDLDSDLDSDLEDAAEHHDGESDAEASLTTGDPRGLDPGPPSWDGPFVGPTTWDQLSAMAAARGGPVDDSTEDADATNTEHEADTEHEASTDAATEASDIDHDTDEEVSASDEIPTPSVAGLSASNDVDELFGKLSELGSSGPVSVLSLSDRNPAAGLTAGFELADELRAVGANVLLIDVRIENPVLDSLFDDGPGSGLAQVMTGDVVLGEAVRNLSGLDGLDLLTVGIADADTAGHLVGPAFQRLLSEARLTYHSIVVIGDAITVDGTAVDSSAGDDREQEDSAEIVRARSLAAAVDALIVGTADPAGTTASDELVAVLDSFDAPTLQLVTAPVPAASDTVPEASSV